MNNFKEIIEEIKNIISKDENNTGKKIYNKQVAEALSISETNFGTMVRRDKIPYHEILDFCAKRRISVNYLLYGQSPESLIDPTNNLFMARFTAVNNTAEKVA